MDYTSHSARRTTGPGAGLRVKGPETHSDLCSFLGEKLNIQSKLKMSRSPDTKEDPVECPLCMEPLEIDDINFFPCTCGYQICRFCWHRIRTDENGLCPACRKPYPEDPAVYKPLSQEELQRIKNEKKQKQNERKQKISENRKHLASVRVVQKNLVFVVGLSQRLADPEVLKRPEYFGKFGKIHKVVINNSTSYAGSQGPSASAYVTYIRSEDALRAIQCVNNVVVDGRTLKASLGTTKYCSYFLKNMQCPKPDCMYLHELGDEAASFTKEEMQAGKHQEYEQKLLQELYKLNPNFLHQSSSTVDKNKNKLATQQRYDAPVDKPPEALSLGNGDNLQQIPTSETPSPPPGLTKPNPVVPISSSNHNARSPFEGAAAESQSLFSDNSNFRHPNPLPNSLLYPTSSPSTHDWPTAPEPQSLFTSETIPVSSSTDWQAAFGFGSSKQQEDDLGFDPFDITRKALADLIEKELSVQDQPSNTSLTSLTSLQTPPQTANKGIGGFLTPSAATTANSIGNSFPNSILPRRFPAFQHRAVYNSFSFPGQARYPWMAYPHNSMMHLNHTATPTSNSNFLDLNIPPHSTGLGGIPISGVPASTGNSLDTLQDENPPHWLKSLQTLTEMDGPTAAQTGHSNPFNTQIPLHRAGWTPYPPPSNPGNFHSPPPGFQSTFRPPNKTPTDLLQSSTLDRH
ncbi:CCR4-NOT transcription complex subunit 4 isoform X11 [Rhincodon typus]|uniref:CCR4-NOT transcription complex subunit 4 isoform X11 n=1 Tax=Rhincodon typus TaxID=259920 RepID=UPI0020305AA6|nr:CCR4-NOT transcription complex subunit 4 isoform X11 [Rhincodon typus]